MVTPVLRVDELTVEFDTPEGVLRAVDGISFSVLPGETVGLVGESGCGKTVTALSLLGLVPAPGRITSGRIEFEGRDLRTSSRRQLRRLRGERIAMVFQDPMTSLDPLTSIRQQLVAVLRAHHRAGRRRHRDRARELLEAVGVPRPADRADQHPHEWSGGMRQRAMIAMAVANGPSLLIADEPTTALDVTVQAQVIDVLDQIRRQSGMATLMISHDLALISEVADRVLVMYAGRVCEAAPVDELFAAPRHPYTRGLIESLPSVADDQPVRPVAGQPPSLIHPPPGCRFHPRCELGAGRAVCRTDSPPLWSLGPERRSACHFADEVAPPTRQTEGAG